MSQIIPDYKVIVLVHLCWPWTNSEQDRRRLRLCEEALSRIEEESSRFPLLWFGPQLDIEQLPIKAPRILFTLREKSTAIFEADEDMESWEQALDELLRSTNEATSFILSGFWSNLCVKELADMLRQKGRTSIKPRQLSVRRLVY